jgi:hypothetical protein
MENFKSQNEYLKELLSLWDGSFPEESARKILERKPSVAIFHNDETGEWQYSIVLVGTDLWLDSFATQKEAIDFLSPYGVVPFFWPSK